MMENFQPKMEKRGKDEKREKPKKFLGVLSFIRHSKAGYSEGQSVLVEDGKKLAKERGKELREKFKARFGDYLNRHYISSPADRAVETTHILQKEIGGDFPRIHISNQIRPVDADDFLANERRRKKRKNEKRENPINTIKDSEKKENGDQEESYEESKSNAEFRALRALEYLIKSFDKSEKPPHVVTTSHIEIAEPLLRKIFGQKIAFDYVEDVEVSFYKKENSKNILLKFRFKGMEKEVEFDREKREIIF